MKTGHFRADLEKYYRIEFGGKKATLWRKAKLWSTHLGLHCVAVYRLSRHSRNLLRRRRYWAAPLSLLSEVLAFLVKFFHHVDIFAAEIGPGFYIGHLGTIYIGKTRIGENVSVTHNLTIGTGLSGGFPSLPTVGKNVWIGSGCILYGNIHVGNGVTVNCGTVLSRSVPDGCLVGGNPGRIISGHHDNSKLFGIARAGAPAMAAAEDSLEIASSSRSASSGSFPDPRPLQR
jgi:serine acetyltransferase